MDELLRNVITRIEASKLPDVEKDALYEMIAEGLQSTVWPILLKYMPKDQLEDLATHPSKVNLEAFGSLIENTVKDGKALAEIQDLMTRILTEVDAALTEQGIPPAPELPQE